MSENNNSNININSGRDYLHDDTADEHHHRRNNNKYDDDDDDDDEISTTSSIESFEAYINFKSIRDPSTQLEEGVSFNWPGIYSSNDDDCENGEKEEEEKKLREIVLSTLLEEDDLAPLFDGSRWAGTRLWGAAVRAIQYIADQPELLPQTTSASSTTTTPSKSQAQQQIISNSNTTMIELGCGLGVPGMIYHMLGGSVVLTDQANILSQLEKNVVANFSKTAVPTVVVVDDDDNESKEQTNTNTHTDNDDGVPQQETQQQQQQQQKQHQRHQHPYIQAMPLSWSRTDITHLLQQCKLTQTGFDIVLNCDCIYEPLYGKSWKLLLETIDELLKVNPKCKVITSVERRQGDGIELFLQGMEELEFVGETEKVLVDEGRKIEIYVTVGGKKK